MAKRTWDQFRGNGGYGLAHLTKSLGIEFTHHQAVDDARAAGMLMLLAIEASGTPLHKWVDDVGYASTVDTSPRRIQTPAYAGKKVAQPGMSDGPLAGETIVFTGALQIARQEAAHAAAAAGCDVADSVTKKITILVVGDQDLRLTKGQEKSSKHRKVEGMIADGASIRIVGETDFMLMVQ